MKQFIELRNFLILWFGQSLSSLGNNMSSFAITIWAFERTGSVLVLSISSLLIMLPRMASGVLAGPFVDRMDKKRIMICADIGAAICTLVLFVLLRNDALEIWHIYVLNGVTGVLGSFQMLAGEVAVTAVVPKQHFVRASGLQSFSSGIIQIAAPAFAAIMLSISNITTVIIADFITMAFACLSLIFFVKIPDTQVKTPSASNFRIELAQGLRAITRSKLLFRLMIFMIFVNFVTGITYFNMLSPMVLARSGNNTAALAVVNSAVGIGSMVGAVLTLYIPARIRKTKIIFISCAVSFILGDVLFAIGNTTVLWAAAGFMSSVFIPAIVANIAYFWRTIIPIELQGRAFALKYALQSGAIPVGMLVGGILADFVFEPLMMQHGSGSGMALMFFITGVVGMIISVIAVLGKSFIKEESN